MEGRCKAITDYTDKSGFMKYKTIQIDCNNMSEKELNKTMKELLGFPDFYGMNWDAMIGCLSYMRYPHEQMTELTLEEDETLIIYCKNLPKAKFDIPIFIDVIEAVNERGMNDGHSPQIFLCPIC